MTDSRHVVVLGAGQAGCGLVSSLRNEGFDGRLTLVSDELDPPYGRPPLSKSFLTAPDETDASPLGTGQGVTLLLGRTGVRLDRRAQELTLADGSVLRYDHLVFATGARNRALVVPGVGLPGIVALRTLTEARELRRRLLTARNVVVVGGGFLGLEIAAAAALRATVTVLEAGPRILGRGVSPRMAGWIANAHRRDGIEIRVGDGVAGFDGDERGVAEVTSSSGDRHPTDLVVVCVGVVPNDELAAAAGLAVADGVVVDEHLSTADPRISAIGDCARFPGAFAPRPVRLESVQNAVDQARSVARRLLGLAEPYDDVPWFWSDQGELKLRIAGLSSDGDCLVVRGDERSGRFSVFCFQGDRLVAVESVNRTADHMAARRLLAGKTLLHPSQAADEQFDLKGHAASAALK